MGIPAQNLSAMGIFLTSPHHHHHYQWPLAGYLICFCHHRGFLNTSMHNVFKDRDHCSGQLVRAGEKWTLFRRILSQDDVRWLSQALCMENSLQSLDLNGCDIGDEKLSKSHLAKALELSYMKTIPLINLNLDNNSLGDAGAALIATACKNHPALTELHLSDNLIDKQGIRALAEMLCHNDVLLNLHLDRNHFGLAGAPLLAYAFTFNCTLQKVTAMSNSLGPSIHLRDAIRINIGLVEFKWEGEDLGDLSTRQAARAANPPPPDLPFPDDPVEIIPADGKKPLAPNTQQANTNVAPLVAPTVQNPSISGHNAPVPVAIPIIPIAPKKVTFATLHEAVVNLDAVEEMVTAGADLAKKDSRGCTPLMCAAEKGNVAVVEYLAPLSPWHTTNAARLTFLDIALKGSFPQLAAVVLPMADHAMDDEKADPSHRWAAVKYFEKTVCTPLDDLMDMTGLRSVKSDALKLFSMVRADLERPPEARISTKQAMNFLFLGNPGSGKTTVARIFGEILSSLGIRAKGAFVETSGQDLLSEGSAAFPPVLAGATPGVLFIDEVYQLDAKNNQEGRAITNALMKATEDDRERLTVIVAGYKDDVQEKWIASNPGLSSRFPFTVTFEDFNAKELREIFLGMVAKDKWQIEPFTNDNGQLVDVALVAARRLSRGANSKGFSNARSVRVMKEAAMRNASSRQMLEKKAAGRDRTKLSQNHSSTLTLPDVLGAPIDPSSHPLIQELLAMTGLDDVKRSVLGLLEMAKENYRSELRGEGVLEIALHRMFLGNPGTGKTTIAKLYGQILHAMGFLSNGGVELVGASKLTGDVVGSTAKKVNEYIDSLQGKVGIIDEAYVLGRSNSIYGREALETLVERVQGIQDFAVILCGYGDDMKAMIRDGNQGLARRFKMEDAFHFADYSDTELTTIFLERAKNSSLHVTEQLAKDAVFHVLAKERAKPNFGNVGSINNLLDRGKERMMKRDDKQKIDGRWVLNSEDLYDTPEPNAAMKALEKLVNNDAILKHIHDLQKRVKKLAREGNDPEKVKKVLKSYVFVGPPGTGKTTAARAFGEVFHGLGLISSPLVVECKAQELIGQYVGQSAPLVTAKMEEARGAVLFIDEAYGLDASKGSPYAKDAMEMLLSNMTDPKYEGKMVVILAGYTHHMSELLSSNPGLHRRFTERLEFKAWNADACLDLVVKRCTAEGVELPETLHTVIIDGFTELSQREGWGNAGDVVTIVEKMVATRDCRCDDDGFVEGPFTEEDVQSAFSALQEQRRPLASPMEQFARSVNNFPAAALMAQACSEDMPVRVTEALNEKTNQKTVEREEQQEAQADPSDIELKSSLDEALGEMGYDIYRVRVILRSKQLPLELVTLVAKKLRRPVPRVRPMLVAQCSELLPGVEQLIADIEGEQELQRLKQEAIERANEAERLRLIDEERKRQAQTDKEREEGLQRLKQEAIERANQAERLRLIEEERQRQPQMIMERVRRIGRCPANFEWRKERGGYRCAGGTHFVSDSELNFI